MTLRTPVIFSLLALWLAAAGDHGQTPTATLSGIVSDEQKAVMAGAMVTVRNSETGKTRSGATDAEGRYSFTNLEPGRYELRVEAPGYKTLQQSGLILTVGGTAV